MTMSTKTKSTPGFITDGLAAKPQIYFTYMGRSSLASFCCQLNFLEINQTGCLLDPSRFPSSSTYLLQVLPLQIQWK